jgi:hypothetical protein
MSEASDSLSCDFDGDQEHNYYTCAFCDDEVYGQAALKDHVESATRQRGDQTAINCCLHPSHHQQ